MALLLQWVVYVVGGFALWVAGAVFFDVVHWVLHQMLNSRWSLVRALAWPHGVHHEWLDRDLRTRWELQTWNIFCHLVPEFLTQLVFSALASLFFPIAVVGVCVAMQTVIFLGLLSFRGLDINHRQIDVLDAYQPSWMAVPAYHALHHVYPDAYFSAYGKLVDWFVGGGAMLRGRRFTVIGEASALRTALVAELGEIGARVREDTADTDMHGLDVMVLIDPREQEVERIEAFIRSAGRRLLPPEVWALHLGPVPPTARFYYRDVRVVYRVLSLQGTEVASEEGARLASRQVLSGVRRGFNFIYLGSVGDAWRAFRRFRRQRGAEPAGVTRVRSRHELACAEGNLVS